MRISDWSSVVCSSDLGLSGGIDSALSAAVAVDALGAERVWCVMMPSRFTSRYSLADAAECTRLLGVRLDSVPIEPALDAFDRTIGTVLVCRIRNITYVNFHSPMLGLPLMATSTRVAHLTHGSALAGGRSCQ